MTLPRGILGVYAMGRPARPPEERHAVRAAASRMGKRLAIAAKAQRLADEVVAETLRYIDMDLADPIITALAELEQQLVPDPVFTLARNASIATATDFLNRRRDLYEARGCRQISAEAFQAETRAIGREMKPRLAARYARHLRK